jgi:hypothetical protein
LFLAEAIPYSLTNKKMKISGEVDWKLVFLVLLLVCGIIEGIGDEHGHQHKQLIRPPSHGFLRGTESQEHTTTRRLPGNDFQALQDWGAQETGIASGLLTLLVIVFILYCCCGCSPLQIIALICCWEICCDDPQ